MDANEAAFFNNLLIRFKQPIVNAVSQRCAMNLSRVFFLLSFVLLLTGCAGMMMVTPQLQLESADRKMEVKAKVMAVSVLDYSPDGKQLVSGGVTSMVRVWDMANARGLRILPFPAQYGVRDVAYSPDGKLLAASGLTGMLGGDITHLWDAETGKKIMAVPGEFGNELAFSPDGLYLLGSERAVGGLFSLDPVRFHSKQLALQSGAIVRTFTDYRVGAMSPDGRHALLVVEARHEGLALVELQSGREIWRTGAGADAVAFTPDRRYILASRAEFHGTLGTSATVSVALLDAATGNQVRELVRYASKTPLWATKRPSPGWLFSKCRRTAAVSSAATIAVNTNCGTWQAAS